MRLRELRRVRARLAPRHLLGDVLRERLELVPLEPALAWHDDVEALAAGRLHEAVELELAKERPQLERGERDALPVEALVGIEVEHDQIRTLELVGARTPRVDLERAELRERDEPGAVGDLHVV